jgi:hypothetical protein
MFWLPGPNQKKKKEKKLAASYLQCCNISHKREFGIVGFPLLLQCDRVGRIFGQLKTMDIFPKLKRVAEILLVNTTGPKLDKVRRLNALFSLHTQV